MSDLVIFWCRRDFRLIDNPALSGAVSQALKHNFPFLPIFILDSEILNNPKNNIGFPRKFCLCKILANFGQQFEHFPIFDTINPTQIFDRLCRAYKIHLFCNFDVDPYSIIRDKEVKEIVLKHGGEFSIFRDQLSIDPQTVSTTGNLYTVFTPFKNKVLNDFLTLKTIDIPDINNIRYEPMSKFQSKSDNFIDAGKHSDCESIFQSITQKLETPWILRIQKHQIHDETDYFEFNLDNYFGRPNLDQWYFSETEALELFDEFIDDKIKHYKSARDFMELDKLSFGATSRMSLGLKWGLVSTRTLVNQILKIFPDISANESILTFISELIWREFYKYILLHHPKVLDLEFQKKYQKAPLWVDDMEAVNRFEKWFRGQTGYPLVDASMYQIQQMGWMHNRSRMLVGSILTKNFGVDWRWGQDYFRALLVDLDEASNNGGWQWSASTGADPKPIRIFNPYLQAEKYDANGIFQKTWLPDNYNFPKPIIEHAIARQEALERYGLVTSKPSKPIFE